MGKRAVKRCESSRHRSSPWLRPQSYLADRRARVDDDDSSAAELPMAYITQKLPHRPTILRPCTTSVVRRIPTRPQGNITMREISALIIMLTYWGSSRPLVLWCMVTIPQVLPCIAAGEHNSAFAGAKDGITRKLLQRMT